MKADVTRRLAIDPSKHYVGVLHQQGRVWLDSDWNEDVLERLHLLEEETRDIVGDCGTPDPGTSFLITPSDDKKVTDDFNISGGLGAAGRFYVDGIVAQLDAKTTYKTQPDLLIPPRITLTIPEKGEVRGLVYLEVWQRLITYLEDGSIREVALGGPDSGTRLKTIAQVKVLIPPVPPDGSKLSCESPNVLPQPGKGRLTTLQPTNAQPPDPCQLPDPANYTGRENHLYRVEVHDAGDVLGSAADRSPFTQKLGQDSLATSRTLVLSAVLSIKQAEALVRSGIARLSDNNGQSEDVTVASVDSSRTTVTLMTAAHGTYTVANGAALRGGAARFKWSRDNASFAVQVVGIGDGKTLTLDGLGRDQATALRSGDLVEIVDDASDLGPARGHLTYLTADPDPDLLTANLQDALPLDTFRVDRHLTLRRWDGVGMAQATFDEATTPDMDLGDGVHLHFGGSDLRAGDFWQFAARAADGSVEALTNAPPTGIQRHYCALAVIGWQDRLFFRKEMVLPSYREAGFGDKLTQLREALDANPDPFIDLATAISILQTTVPGAAANQIEGLTTSLKNAATKPGANVERRMVIADIEDCRKPFDPLTKRHDCCDCTVTVAQGQSLSDAIAKIGARGGVVCLLPGVHPLLETVVVSAKPRLTIRGAGAATVIQAAKSAVALRFQGCDDLTLRDFTTESGVQSPVDPKRPATITKTSDLDGTIDKLSKTPIDGVITFVDCLGVEVTRCTVRCLGIGPTQTPRTAMTFMGSSNGARVNGTVDLTVRDCRLIVDFAQSGLLILRGTSVAIEGSTVANLASFDQLRSTGSVKETVPAQWGLFGFAFLSSLLISVSRNVIVGLDVAVLSTSEDVTLLGNDVRFSGFGVAHRGGSVLALDGNTVSTNRGLALRISEPPGDVIIRGNAFTAGTVSSEGGGSGSEAAVADVRARVATIAHNSFHLAATLKDQPPSHVVGIRASSITFDGNRSTSGVRPSRTNVLLWGLGDKTTEHKITAFGNTCLEPSENDIDISKVLDLQGQQDVLVTDFLTGSFVVGTHQTKLADLKSAWDPLGQTITEIVNKRGLISLMAVAGTSVTGLNLLTYGLLRVGLGTDQGTVTGVLL